MARCCNICRYSLPDSFGNYISQVCKIDRGRSLRLNEREKLAVSIFPACNCVLQGNQKQMLNRPIPRFAGGIKRNPDREEPRMHASRLASTRRPVSSSSRRRREEAEENAKERKVVSGDISWRSRLDEPPLNTPEETTRGKKGAEMALARLRHRFCPRCGVNPSEFAARNRAEGLLSATPRPDSGEA